MPDSTKTRRFTASLACRWSLMAAMLLTSNACWGKQAQWEESSDAEHATRKAGESEGQALYRAGVRCMDTYERNDCAIEYFEKLIDKNPKEPELVSDGLFRLYALYQREGRDEDATLLLRKFWEAGMKGGSAGNLHYPARWLPRDFSTLYSLDISRYRESRMSELLSEDAHDTVFTCNEARREQLETEAKARREKKKAERLAKARATGEDLPPEAQPDPEASTPEAAGDETAEEQFDSVYEEGRCALARALDTEDTSQWTKMTSAFNTLQRDRSAAIYGISKIEKRIATGVESGRLLELGDGTWQIADLVHAKGQRVRIAIVDLDTVVLAGDEVMDELLATKKANEQSLHPALSDLVTRVPRDVTFFTIMAPEAVKQGMLEAGALANFLPEPEGMMMSVVSYDYAGIFVRMPTSSSMKTAALVSVIEWAMNRAEEERRKEEGEGGPMGFGAMDVSQSRDGKALQMSAVVPPENIERMLLE
jgi:hypothetical protein